MNFIDRYLRKLIAKVHAGAPGEMAAKNINRYSIVVYPLEPYAEWAARIAKLKPDETLLILQTSSQASFLLPQTDTPPHLDEDPLKEIYPDIFDYMLHTWEQDRTPGAGRKTAPTIHSRNGLASCTATSYST